MKVALRALLAAGMVLASAPALAEDGDQREAATAARPFVIPVQLNAADRIPLLTSGRADLVLNEGWWEQPPKGSPAGTLWRKHPFTFSEDRGGAQMLVYDVNGDGQNDIVTAKKAAVTRNDPAIIAGRLLLPPARASRCL